MPRKVNYGVNYEEDFDDYEDYGYDYDDGYDYAEENGALPETRSKQESVKSGVWRCPICTFDNEDTMNVCDICGVLRNPLVKKCVSSKENADGSSAVGGICKDSGASVMAKSLFPSLLLQKAKNAMNFEAQNHSFKTEDCFNFYKPGNICGQFHDLHRAFCSQSHCKIDIVPFKFDSPSPDDLVLRGIAPSRLHSKGDTATSLQSNIASNNKELSTEVKKELAAEGHPNSKISLAKVKHDDLDSGSSSKTRGNNGLTSNLNDLSISSKSHSVVTGKSDGATTSSKNKPQKTVQSPQTEDNFNQLNLAIVGHVDSGKSTLSGRLLHLLGQISHKEMQKYEKEAKQQGKGSFAYAWALDESAEERERGITMTVGVAYFKTKCYRVVLLDSPGHRDFVPNMISGATQADAAILVIDASVGAFEAGIDATGGQTREHVQLIKSFGVDQIIIAVNKMDTVGYSVERFDAIKKQLGTFLRACKFKDTSVAWIPLSAMENQNLVTGPSESRMLSWFQGPCLLDAIDSLQPPQRDYSKPFLMPICDVRAQSQGQVSICGKLERGALQTGNKVLVMPSRKMATVRSLECDSQVFNTAKAGDSVTINLQGIDANHVIAGGVLCHPEFPVPVANHLELKVLILDNAIPILIGSQLEFLVHHAKEAARVVRILSLLDPKTGKETKKSPRCLLAKQNAKIEVGLQGMVCIDEYSSCKALGRVSLRSSGRTVALGLVTRVIGKLE